MERKDPARIRALQGPPGPPGARGPKGERGDIITVATEPPETDSTGFLWYSPDESPAESAGVVVSPDEPISPPAGMIWLDTSS